jgi:hypothetical protein
MKMPSNSNRCIHSKHQGPYATSYNYNIPRTNDVIERGILKTCDYFPLVLRIIKKCIIFNIRYGVIPIT